MADRNSTSDFYVYTHTRATDGKVFYVGKGKGNRAWETNRNKYWKNVAAKYGYNVTIVQDGMKEWWAFELECELIALYGRENLCNLTDGGEGASGAIRSAETIAKNIALHTGKKRSIESRQRMSDAQKLLPKRDITGDKNPAKREDVRAKMRKPRPSIQGENNPMRRDDVKRKLHQTMQSQEYKLKMSVAVKNSMTDEVKQKMRDAQIESYKDESRLKKAMENLQNIQNDKNAQAKRIASLKETNANIRKKILCVTNGMVFNNQCDAVRWLHENGFTKATAIRISEVVRGIRNKAYGMGWSYK